MHSTENPTNSQVASDGHLSHRVVDCALAMAAKGFRVFPIQENGKLPLLGISWKKLATSDPARIKKLWGDKNYNFGIECGKYAEGKYLSPLDYDVKVNKKTGVKARGAEAFAAHQWMDLPVDGMRSDTPSGGWHLFFWSDRPVRNSASKLANGCDVRGEGGYVVGPGSIIDGKPYVLRDGPIPQLPAWVFKLIDTKRTNLKDTRTPLSEPDRPEQITAATNWLINEAPEAIAGAGGDAMTFEVACRVKDFGVTKETCFELMGDHWNDDKAHPPWNGEALEQKVINAYAYGSLPPGILDPRGEFGALPPELVASIMAEAPVSEGECQTTSEADWRAPTLLDADFDFGSIPPRQWIVDKFLCRGFVTGLISPGGVGKTQLAAALTVSIPTGRSDACGMKIREPVKTWYWNQEDNIDEMMRRVGAVVQKYGIDRDAIRGKVHINSGVENQLMLSRRKDRAVMRSADVPVIIRHIKANGIGVFIIDPLVEFHEADENSNPEMKKVVGYARDIATATGCAVLIVVHSKKPSQGSSDGHVGEAESARGASAQTNIFRIAYTFHTLSKKDAKNWGIDNNDAHLYARLDNAKANLFLGGGDPVWYRRVPVTLGLPDGDVIGVMDPVTLSAKSRETDILELLARAMSRDQAFSGGAFFPLSEILEKVPAPERAAFGEASNRSHLLSKAVAGIGWVQTGDKHTGYTQFGRLTVIKKKGRGGYQFSLNPEAKAAPAELVNSVSA